MQGLVVVLALLLSYTHPGAHDPLLLGQLTMELAECGHSKLAVQLAKLQYTQVPRVGGNVALKTTACHTNDHNTPLHTGACMYRQNWQHSLTRHSLALHQNQNQKTPECSVHDIYTAYAHVPQAGRVG